MDQEKIQQLEEEIKNLHYNAKNIISKFSFKEFWDIHIVPVIKYSKQMSEKYGADLESVWLGAILHDIARITGEDPHDEIGSEKAYKLLLEKGFGEEVAQKVKGIILTHRCKQYLPETLEQKIIASADAMAHFLPPFYLWVGIYTNKTFAEALESNMKKIERDYNDKIFFEEEKEAVREEYEVLKKWFEFKV